MFKINHNGSNYYCCIATIAVAASFLSNKSKVRRNLTGLGKTSIMDFKHGTVGKIVGNVYQHKSSVSFLGMNRRLQYFEGIIHVKEATAIKGKGEWEMR